MQMTPISTPMRCMPHEVYPHEMHAYEVSAHEVYPYEMHARKMHAHETHAREMHAREVHAHKTHVHQYWNDSIRAMIEMGIVYELILSDRRKEYMILISYREQATSNTTESRLNAIESYL